MNAEVRLAEIITALETVGLTALVLGGHAVRFYGWQRNTSDFDLQLAPECWDDLLTRLSQTNLFPDGIPVEGPSWRPNAFRRFQIGTLPSGREEWLEFWRDNHLLSPFPEVYARRVEGTYGGRPVPFLALGDLIRSKETERESDWQDITVLEEFLDASHLIQAKAGKIDWAVALAQLRSRRGFESLLQEGIISQVATLHQALEQATLSVSQAYLLPFAPAVVPLRPVSVPIEPVVLSRLRAVAGGSPLHLALVELVRRQYKVALQAQDRANKEAIRAGQLPS